MPSATRVRVAAPRSQQDRRIPLSSTMASNSRYRTYVRAHLYAAFTLHARSSPRSVQLIISDTHIVCAMDHGSFQRQKHVEPSASATPSEEACLKRRPSPVEAQDATPDLQLSLFPSSVLAKKRKTISSSSMDTTSCEFSISLSLSPPATAVSMQQQQQQRQQKTRRSSDSSGGGEGVLGQSTLDLTMSIRALE